jgi:radical SAM superfamily enzyme YgiQ (UPF0313 family)
MDILLTHGYFIDGDPAEQKVMKPYPPLGLLYISSYLKQRDFTVEILDSTFITLEAAQTALAAKRPRIVGIYANLITRGNALKLAATCKAWGAIVVLGGPEPANYQEEYLSHGADIVVIGEGEATLAELIPHLRRHGMAGLELICGLAFINGDGKVVQTPPRAKIRDLDSLPFPDREGIDLEAYLSVWKKHHGVRSVSLITARGCPYTCEWCSHAVFGHSHRQRSPENVADEIEHIAERYAPDQLWYADDVFTLNPKWLEKFAAEIKRRGVRFPFETISREDRLNERVARLLAEIGCYRLWIGAESGSQAILDAMDRRTNAPRMREMIKLIKSEGIRAGTFIMLGYEGETWRDISLTAEHLRLSIPDDVLTTISYPIKGTPYYEKISSRIRVTTPWAQSSDRHLFISGRKSRKFYRHAGRWLVAQTELARLAEQGGISRRRARAAMNSALHRLQMYLRWHEIEYG